VAVGVVGSVLAHQGGWDEILFVLAPLAVLAGLLLMARRRLPDLEDDESARARAEAGGPEGPGTP
jgi:predicted MFS family arabinose efflux permease